MKTTDVDDAELVAKAIRGDNDSYGLLMTRYEFKLLRYVTYLIGDADAAADVVQDTFIKTYQNLRNYKPAYKFSSWIYRIAHNEAMNALKRNKHLSNVDIDVIPEVAYEPGLAEAFDAKLVQQDVQECLRALKPKYKEVVQLIYFEHMKYDEAGEILRIPTSTVGVWLKRAKDALRKICEQKGAHHA